METLSKEILTGKGLEDLMFGQTKEQVKSHFGEPDEIEQYADEETEEVLNEAWHYDSLELSLSFDKDEDWRLSTISVSDESFTLKGKKLIGSTMEELTGFINENKLGEFEAEEWSTEDDDIQQVVSIDGHSINFWFTEGKLSEIQWGPLYDQDDKTIWPN